MTSIEATYKFQYSEATLTSGAHSCVILSSIIIDKYLLRMGHAIQNSRALLNALHDQERTLELVHCCVGPFNTTTDKDGNNCAILIGSKVINFHSSSSTWLFSGIAIDLDSGTIFPAEFPWNNFEDFSEQLKDRVNRRTGQGGFLSDEDRCKTKLSTFKPKALRNPNTYKNLQNTGKEGEKKGWCWINDKSAFLMLSFICSFCCQFHGFSKI